MLSSTVLWHFKQIPFYNDLCWDLKSSPSTAMIISSSSMELMHLIPRWVNWGQRVLRWPFHSNVYQTHSKWRAWLSLASFSKSLCFLLFLWLSFSFLLASSYSSSSSSLSFESGWINRNTFSICTPLHQCERAATDETVFHMTGLNLTHNSFMMTHTPRQLILALLPSNLFTFFSLPLLLPSLFVSLSFSLFLSLSLSGESFLPKHTRWIRHSVHSFKLPDSEVRDRQTQ